MYKIGIAAGGTQNPITAENLEAMKNAGIDAIELSIFA